jgi:azurin
MKNKKGHLLIFLLLLAACGQPGTGGSNRQPAVKDSAQLTIPGAENLAFTDTIRLSANENMHFDKELFRVRSGKITGLVFHNTGAANGISMDHNVVILNRGVDIADFADLSRTAKNENYIPAALTSVIVAHTKLVKGGSADTISFTIREKGVYDFICSYPGHWGTMQGKIVAQ